MEVQRPKGKSIILYLGSPQQGDDHHNIRVGWNTNEWEEYWLMDGVPVDGKLADLGSESSHYE